MRKLFAIGALLLVLTSCGTEYDPDLCEMWTDLYNVTETGHARVQMDRFCTR